MNDNRKGISLITLILTVAVLIIIATVTIQNGMQRTDEARIARHNININATQEEVENYYNYKGGELPVVDLTPYQVASETTLYEETIKNGDDTDKFYILDSSKLGKVSGEDENGADGKYIVSATRHTVYYVNGTTVKGVTYHGIVAKNDVKLMRIYAYNNPIVPIGFSHIGTETWDNGFTIQDSSGNQFVWVPALTPVIQANGTLDNTTFNSKFGRRNFRGELFNSTYFHETTDNTFQDILASVNKYGGFYIAKYEASNNGGRGQCKTNTTSWTNIDWNTAKAKAESMDTDWKWDESIESYLCYGAHWDTILQWIIDTGAKTSPQVITDSTSFGNCTDDTFSGTTGRGNTGQWSETSVKGIYDLAGNVEEWTMESNTTSYRVGRGGSAYQSGITRPLAYRNGSGPTDIYPDLGWRAVLCIK